MRLSMMRSWIVALLMVAAASGATPPIAAPGTFAKCSICPAGQTPTLPNAAYTFAGTTFTCGQLATGGLLGVIPPAACQLILTTPIPKVCGCKGTPIKSPVKAPVKKPVEAPVKKPVKAPVKAPLKKPVKAPLKTPPVKKPVKKPVFAPVKKLGAPVKKPV